MREIITLQLGNFSNFLGAHFWNIQECGLDPELGADGEPVVHPGHAEPSVLYRQGRKEQERHPRLVLCDGADRFGSLSRDGVVHTEAAHIDERRRRQGRRGDAGGGGAPPANAFLQMLHSPVSQEWSPGAGRRPRRRPPRTRTTTPPRRRGRWRASSGKGGDGEKQGCAPTSGSTRR